MSMAKLYPLIYGMICAYLGFLYHQRCFFPSKNLEISRAKNKTSDLARSPWESIFFSTDDDLVGTDDDTRKWLDVHPEETGFSIFSVITTSISLFFYLTPKNPRW